MQNVAQYYIYIVYIHKYCIYVYVWYMILLNLAQQQGPGIMSKLQMRKIRSTRPLKKQSRSPFLFLPYASCPPLLTIIAATTILTTPIHTAVK